MKLDKWSWTVEKTIFTKHGYAWAEKERNKVIEELYDPWRLKRLLSFTHYYLGSSSSPEDAEDAFSKFVLNRICNNQLINKYDPTKGRFLAFFKGSLKYYISDIRKARIKHYDEVSIDRDDKDDDEIHIELKDENLNSRPEKQIECQQIIDCINQLTGIKKIVLIYHYFENYSYDDIADMMRKTANNVRQIAVRARGELSSRLEEKGIVPKKGTKAKKR